MIGALALFFFFLKFSLVKTLGVEGLKKKKKTISELEPTKIKIWKIGQKPISEILFPRWVFDRFFFF